MGKSHLKRVSSPKSWQILRKTEKFITKPSPGPHRIASGIPLNVMLKEVLNHSKTTRESGKAAMLNEIKVDGKPRKDLGFQIGVFDTIEIPASNEFYRAVLGSHGKIVLAKISKEESAVKPCKITGKTMVSGKLQINLYDGKNILVEPGSYKVGDTVMLSLPDNKVKKHLKLEKKSTIFLIGGKHSGDTGNVEGITGDKITYKDSSGELIETLREYAFVIGDSKPLITTK